MSHLTAFVFGAFRMRKKNQPIIGLDLDFGDVVAVIYLLISNCHQASAAFKLNIATVTLR